MFSTLDIVVTVLVVLMSIKGYINGFLREFFGLLGLVGGIFIASGSSTWIGSYINHNIFHISNFALLKLISFILVLAIFWGLVSFVGSFFAEMPSDEKSTSNRLLGVVIAGIKYFFIFALIVTALFNNPMIKDNMGHKIKNSKLYPTLEKVGSIIMHKDADKSK